MADRVSAKTRSAIMASVKTKDTGPELALRKMLHRLGFRYSLHNRRLPGSPDLAFPARRKAIFVHGCFWHGHSCRWGRLPKSKLDYWGPKIEANRARDLRNARRLRKAGWSVLTVWQCQLKRPEAVLRRAVDFLQRV